MIVRVTKSPHPEDESSKLPWEYSGTAFKNWVWEVFRECGKSGRYPRNVAEAIEVVEGFGYQVEMA